MPPQWPLLIHKQPAGLRSPLMPAPGWLRSPRVSEPSNTTAGRGTTPHFISMMPGESPGQASPFTSVARFVMLKD